MLVGDPMYATYMGLIRASGADVIPVPLHQDNGFCMDAGTIEGALTPHSKVIFLNNPHNPTGAVLSRQQMLEIAELAKAKNLWIISDEVYEALTFPHKPFHSMLALKDFADRVIVASSISKAHAAPGFRSGWCIGAPEVMEALLPLAETMLFGNQPFIADMTVAALNQGSAVADALKQNFYRRAQMVERILHAQTEFYAHPPQAGMFVMVNIAKTGLNGEAYASHLLEHGKVAVMPGTSFGEKMQQWIRIALTVPDETLDIALGRIVQHYQHYFKA